MMPPQRIAVKSECHSQAPSLAEMVAAKAIRPATAALVASIGEV
jgi:hypothetical protein